MNSAVKWGVILAVIVFAINLVSMAAGLHANPMIGLATVVVFILATAACVVMALRATAAQNGYGGQVLGSVVLGIVAGVLILVTSYALMAFVFPNAIEEMVDGQAQMMANMNVPQAQIDAQLAKMEGATAFSQSWPAMFFTIGTSLVVGLIAAIFVRRKN